jgi:hypothetical protein
MGDEGRSHLRGWGVQSEGGARVYCKARALSSAGGNYPHQ